MYVPNCTIRDKLTVLKMVNSGAILSNHKVTSPRSSGSESSSESSDGSSMGSISGIDAPESSEEWQKVE